MSDYPKFEPLTSAIVWRLSESAEAVLELLADGRLVRGKSFSEGTTAKVSHFQLEHLCLLTKEAERKRLLKLLEAQGPMGVSLAIILRKELGDS